MTYTLLGTPCIVLLRSSYTAMTAEAIRLFLITEANSSNFPLLRTSPLILQKRAVIRTAIIIVIILLLSVCMTLQNDWCL